MTDRKRRYHLEEEEEDTKLPASYNNTNSPSLSLASPSSSSTSSNKKACHDAAQTAATPIPSLLSLSTKDVRTNDEIHNSITFCPIMRLFIDTPPIQRLRHLQQLGTASLVYINASHNRLEHSLGVAYLAKKVAKKITKKQPALEDCCGERELLCIKLAGLFHDTGHGPFSHTYEMFVKKVFPKYYQTSLSDQDKARYQHLPKLPEDFCHEDISMAMIDAALAYHGFAIDLQNLDQPLVQSNPHSNLKLKFGPEPEDELTSRDFVFIKECIHGEPIPAIQKATGQKGFVGRRDWKDEWMYDIVANRHSGLDVDKMDYFARDSNRCFGEGKVNKVAVQEAVVAWGDCTADQGFCDICDQPDGRPHRHTHLMLCYTDKNSKALINFFNKRYELHDTIYWHKTTAAAAHMVCDILCQADPYFWRSTAPFGQEPSFPIPSQQPVVSSLPLSRAGLDARAFLRLRDSVIDEISNSTDKKLQSAAKLATQFLNRHLYKCPAEHSIDPTNEQDKLIWKMSEEEIHQALLDRHPRHDDGNITLKAEDFIVEKFTIHHGQKERNPLENIRFVGNSNRSKLRSALIAADLPKAEKPDLKKYQGQTPMVQQQQRIRVFCRDNTKYELLAHVFAQWLTDMHDNYTHMTAAAAAAVTPGSSNPISISQTQGTPQRGGGGGSCGGWSSPMRPDDDFDTLDGPPQTQECEDSP